MTDASQPPDRIHIANEDLNDPRVTARVESMRAASVPQTVRAVGGDLSGATMVQRPWWRNGAVVLGLAGLVGGLLGAILAEVISQPGSADPWYGTSRKLGTIVFLASFLLGLGTVLIGWTGIETRSAEKFRRDWLRALPWLAGGSIAAGYLAQVIYEPLVKNLIRDSIEQASTREEALQLFLDGIHVPRGIAWAVAGAVAGLAIGASKGAARPAVNGLVGGAVGGFIGGFSFDYFEGDGTTSRFAALIITGTLIGAATGLVEEATKQHWIEIVSGGMAGKQFILFQQRTTVGASPLCGITLIKDPDLAPEHAELVASPAGLQLTPMSPAHPVQVNGIAVQSARLGDGDLVTLGSTIIRYRSKSEAMPTMSIPSGSPPVP